MTEEEAVLIAKYVAAMCPQQRFNEFTPDTWADLLRPYSAGEAREAAAAVASRQPFVAPAEIISEIRARRKARIEAANLVYDGDPGETGAQSAANLRELVRAAASGRIPPAAIGRLRGLEAAPPPGGQRARVLLPAVGSEPPGPRPGVADPRAVGCRHCRARPGSPCTSGNRRLTDAHPARREDSRRAAAGLPPADPSAADAEVERRLEASRTMLARLPAGTVIEPQDGFTPAPRTDGQ